MLLSLSELEWKLSQAGALKTTLEENPRKEVRDVMTSSIRGAARGYDSDSDND